MSPIASTTALVIRTLFEAYVVILLVRFLMQKLRASWRNPLSQFVFQLTEKPLSLFRKFIPGFKGFDFAILFFAALVQFIEVVILWKVLFGVNPTLSGTLMITIAKLLHTFIYIYIYGIIIGAISTWIPSLQGNPFIQMIDLITYPLLSKARTVIPLIANIDISPIFVILGLTVVNTLFVSQLMALGTKMILG